MRVATFSSTRRVRQSGVELKLPQAAVVKSQCGERCGKGETGSRQAWSRDASVSKPLQKCRNLLDDVKTEDWPTLRDKLWAEKPFDEPTLRLLPSVHLGSDTQAAFG